MVQQVFFSHSKRFFTGCGILVALITLSHTEASAQLLEEGQGRLRTIKTDKAGFLFFGRKIKSADTKKTRSGKAVKVRTRSESPANYNRNQKPVKTRSTTPVSYNKKDRKVKVRTTAPVSYNRKDSKTKIRTTAPVSYNKKDSKTKIRTTAPVSYNKKDRKTKIRTTAPVSYNKKDRKVEVRTTAPASYNKKDQKVDIRTSTPVSYNRKEQRTEVRYSKKRREEAGMGGVINLKRRMILFGPITYRRKISVSGPMTYKIDQNRLDSWKPAPDYTPEYKGDIKRLRLPLLHLSDRMKQWQRSNFRGHNTGLTKNGKTGHYKSTSKKVLQHEGNGPRTMPLLVNLKDKMRLWEQTHYQGRSDGLTRFGATANFKKQSRQVSQYEGGFKVKKKKGGDMHPSINYISGKRFSSTNWKERWRKLNIKWVRLNPGKEVPDGAKEKYKEKYDKEERDIWTY